MEKSDKQTSELILSKKLKDGKEKTLFLLNGKVIFEALLCFLMQFAGVFANMSPFGIAFYASVFRPEGWMLNYSMSLIGTIISGQKAFWGYASCITCVTVIFALFEKLSLRALYKAITAGAVFVTFTAVRYINSGFTTFDIFALALEAILVAGSVVMFEKSLRVLKKFKTRKFISESESILTYTFIAVVISTLGQLPQPFGFDLCQVAAITLILIMALGAGRGAVLILAVLLGAVEAISGGRNGELMGTYAFGALLATSFRQYGKVGIVLGFVLANTVSSLLLSNADNAVVSVASSLAAAVIFGFVPQRAADFFSELSFKTNLYDTVRTNTIYDTSTNTKRLLRIADSIGELGKIYDNVSKEKIIGTGYMKMMSSEICAKVCAGCKNKDECFKEGGLATKVIGDIWQKDPQRISVTTLPQEFKNKCLRCQNFAQVARGSVMIMKTEKQWLSKLNESRKLVGAQLKSISSIVKSECGNHNQNRDRELEVKLKTELDSASMTPCEVLIRSGNNSYETEIGFNISELSKDSKKIIAAAVEKTISTPVRLGGIRRSGGAVYLSFVPLGTYKANFGYATRAKNGEKVSGDSFNLICAKSSGAVMALSDGMGSGEAAKEESRCVIDMLEKFLHAGFTSENAVKLINSSLLLRGEKDSFATLDICDINLEDATLTFIKLGACTSYIKTIDGTVEVKGESLPAGILRDVKAKRHMLPFSSDTLVIIISDGVADVSLKKPEYEGWIEKELDSLWGLNPQIVAGKLLEKATKLSGAVHDDMTVLVGCISR